jgi:glycine/D-amino acid oxidase-like deaminating enzyme
VLDRVLEDRIISSAEACELEALTQAWGLQSKQVREANPAYVKALVRAALRDGVVSSRERLDLDAVAELLARKPR